MSNKLKVIALLLLVSLLSGCNGTTGSGSQETTIQGNRQPANTTSVLTAEAENPPRSQETTMQGNRQPANTTSVPTAEADNPSLSAGNAVRVARWSRDPKGGSLLAPLEGRIAIVNNCLVMQDQDGRNTLLIFPYNSGVWDGAKRTFTFEGKVIRIGEPIRVGGRFIENLDKLKAYGKYDVPDCGINNFFQVF